MSLAPSPGPSYGTLDARLCIGSCLMQQSVQLGLLKHDRNQLPLDNIYYQQDRSIALIMSDRAPYETMGQKRVFDIRLSRISNTIERILSDDGTRAAVLNYASKNDIPRYAGEIYHSLTQAATRLGVGRYSHFLDSTATIVYDAMVSQRRGRIPEEGEVDQCVCVSMPFADILHRASSMQLREGKLRSRHMSPYCRNWFSYWKQDSVSQEELPILSSHRSTKQSQRFTLRNG